MYIQSNNENNNQSNNSERAQRNFGTPLEKVTPLISLGFLTCCLCFCALPGLAGIMAMNSIREEWPLVNATLVDTFRCKTQNDDSHHLMYNFVTLEGENITTTTDYCSDLHGNQIRYDPENPTIIIDSAHFTLGVVASQATTAVGWIFVAVTLCLLVWGCTRMRAIAAGPNHNNSGDDDATVMTDIEDKDEEDPFAQQQNHVMEIPSAVPADDAATDDVGTSSYYGPSSSNMAASSYPVATATVLESGRAYSKTDAKASSNGPITVYR